MSRETGRLISYALLSSKFQKVPDLEPGVPNFGTSSKPGQTLDRVPGPKFTDTEKFPQPYLSSG